MARSSSSVGSFLTRRARVRGCLDRGQYALWVGSGISRAQAPTVPELLGRLVAELQSRAEAEQVGGKHATTLARVLKDFAGYQGATLDKLVSTDFADWGEDAVAEFGARASPRYADILDVRVAGEQADYLVWDVLRVQEIYGSLNRPGATHLLIASLLLERVFSEVVTTNWDPLIECAFDELGSPVGQETRVIVAGEDLRAAPWNSRLYKIHGCAASAMRDASHRARIVARTEQLSDFTARAEDRWRRDELARLSRDRPAIVLGLSLADANLQSALVVGADSVAWRWPLDREALVFATETSESVHESVLASRFDGIPDADVVQASKDACAGVWPDPFLAQVWLRTVRSKAIECASPGANARESMSARAARAGAWVIGNGIANLLDNGVSQQRVLAVLRMYTAITNSLWTGGEGHSPRPKYIPLVDTTVASSGANMAASSSGVASVVKAAEILVKGFYDAGWRLDARSTIGSPTLRLTRAGREVRLRLLGTTAAQANFRSQNASPPDGEIVVEPNPFRAPTARAPRRFAAMPRAGTASPNLSALEIAQLANDGWAPRDLVETEFRGVLV